LRICKLSNGDFNPFLEFEPVSRPGALNLGSVNPSGVLKFGPGRERDLKG